MNLWIESGDPSGNQGGSAMRSTKAFRLLLITLVVALNACGDDDTSPSSVEFISHTDYGCTASRAVTEDCLEGASIRNIEAIGDTVVLWIRFEANCCPEFTETVAYDAGVLTIDVVDTVYACRCICPFENAFRFLCRETGSLRVLFESRATRGGDICLSGLDTTITMP
jgi:hypothetical protein